MATALAPGLARKLKKVLETRTDSPELLSSLSALSTFYTENTVQARRNLRPTIEKRGLAINEEFLKASEASQKALDAVEAEVEGLAACCERIAKALSSCSASTGDMVVATERLKQDIENTTRRQELVTSFLQTYQLTPDEITALREEELDEKFFKALARVQEIHSNCKVLLRTHHQRAGLELMDVMAVYQEGAYERLCRWVQAECRVLGDMDTPEVSDLLRTAARCLKDRPVLFKYCAEEVANTRRNALFQRFVFALTRGGPGGMPRPIEVHAHDPLRYVGDMLAWLYQALASERELATALFSAGDSVGTASRRFSLGVEDREEEARVEADMASVLDRVFEGVCRPFKIRVEQVLTSQPGLIIAYKLSNLLSFYTHTVAELLGSEAALTSTLQEVTDSATRTFFDIMKQRGDKLLRYPPPVAVDLSPPPAVAEVMSTLLELMDTYEKAMIPSSSSSKRDFEPVMAATLDPLLQMCERAAEAYGTKTPIPTLRRLGSGSSDSTLTPNRSKSDARRLSGELSRSNSMNAEALQSLRNIFMINCFSAVLQPLVGRELAAVRLKQLASAIEGRIAAIVEHEYFTILNSCGLGKKVAVIQSRGLQGPVVGEIQGEDNIPLSQVEDMSAVQVSESLRSLFSLLASNPGGALPEFEQLQVPRYRREASSRVASALADAYETVYKAVLDPNNSYPEPRSMLRHTPEQMRTILGI